MISRETLSLLQCPACFGPDLYIGSGRRPELICKDCERRYPVVQGIPDLVVPEASPAPVPYKVETVSNVLAGIYDFVAPIVNMTVLRCSPLHYIDWENRALGRANSGVYLAAPVGTGITLAPVVASYHHATLLGVDKSWKMLFQASKRFRDANVDIQLFRADYHRLPFKSDVVESLQSLNGLHGFTDRLGTMTEFMRCLKPGGHISGSALIRSQEDVADVFLSRYERYGIYPLLRSPEFLMKELQMLPLDNMHYETHGAVMFYTGEPQ